MAITPTRRVSFGTRLAAGLTTSSLIVLLVLSVLYSPRNGENYGDFKRQLEEISDFSDYSCEHIHEFPNQRCNFARTCNGGNGIWAPFVFCHSNTALLAGLLSPIVVLWLVLLFRMLSSTAEDFFSPALEMFSNQLGLPPRFAGVSLLALGNGAADVSATVSAITDDPQSGYKLSLGALTGAAMMIGTVVSALVIIVADGVPCRGALVRDVLMLGISVVVVYFQLASGYVKAETITLFLTLYAVFVMLVLVADVYHRAVVVPRMQQAALLDEQQRQIELEQQQQQLHLRPSQDRISQVITALSNYDQNELTDGVESEELAQPVHLHGAHGMLDHHHQFPTHDDPTQEYSIMLPDDDNDNHITTATTFSLEQIKMELTSHARGVWQDIRYSDLHFVDRCLLICELPITAARQVTVPIPCEGYYCRSLIALSLAVSPFWFGFYLWHSNGIVVVTSIWYWIVVALMLILALAIAWKAPTTADLPLLVSVPIALYGFVIAATWIDTIADSLVFVLNFVGILLNIPAPVLGLTLLAWGNSMSDLSANITMARKGLANMAMTACFAGPVFNILVGLGLGFASLAAQTGQTERQVELESSVMTGFLFIGLNTAAILVVGLMLGKGRIPKQYGYLSLVLYTTYLVTSISRQYMRDKSEA